MPDTTPGEMGADEVQEYLASLRTRFHNARERKQKRPRGQYKRFLDMLRSNTKIALLPLPKEYFGHTTLASCQTSFDQNAEKLEINPRQYSVYEHVDKQRLLVNWEHPDVDAQFDAWVLANTPLPKNVVAAATREADAITKNKIAA